MRAFRTPVWMLALPFVIFSMFRAKTNPTYVANNADDESFVTLNTRVRVASAASPSPASPNRSASTSAASKSSAGKSATGLSGLPPDAQGPISATLGKDDSGYWVHRSPKGFRGENPRHALVAEFTRRRAEVRSHNLRWGLETADMDTEMAWFR